MGIHFPRIVLAKQIVLQALTGHGSPLATAVPKGHFAVYVGESRKRFVIPTSCLKNSIFQDLLKITEDEFGFGHHNGLTIPCSENAFQALTAQLADR